jgi:hypothetical protein
MHDDRARRLELAAILVTRRDADHGSVAQAPRPSLGMLDTAAHTAGHIAFAKHTGGLTSIVTGGATLVLAGSSAAERLALRAWKNDFR